MKKEGPVQVEVFFLIFKLPRSGCCPDDRYPDLAHCVDYI